MDLINQRDFPAVVLQRWVRPEIFHVEPGHWKKQLPTKYLDLARKGGDQKQRHRAGAGQPVQQADPQGLAGSADAAMRVRPGTLAQMPVRGRHSACVVVPPGPESFGAISIFTLSVSLRPASL